MKRRNHFSDFYKQTHKHFVNLSRRKQREAVIQLKNTLRVAHDVDNAFSSDSYLPEDGTSWFSFQIQGIDNRTIFNITLGCCANDYWGKVDSAAFDKAYILLSKEEQDKEFNFESKPIRKNGKIVYYQMVERVRIKYPQFNGLTFQDYCDQLQSEIHESGEIVTAESITFDPRSEGGLFISAMVNEAVLHYADIVSFIEHFLNNSALMAKIKENQFNNKEVLLTSSDILTVDEIAFGELSRHGNSLALKFSF